MKKDFSQDFEKEPIFAHLIVQDSVSKKYLVYASTEEHEEDFSHILTTNLEWDGPLSVQLAKFLYQNHLVLTYYRELARVGSVAFSFADDTPGVESVGVCFLVVVDVVTDSKLDQEHAKASFVDIYELLQKLSTSPYYGDVTLQGIAQLILEDKTLGNLDQKSVSQA